MLFTATLWLAGAVCSSGDVELLAEEADVIGATGHEDEVKSALVAAVTDASAERGCDPALQTLLRHALRRVALARPAGHATIATRLIEAAHGGASGSALLNILLEAGGTVCTSSDVEILPEEATVIGAGGRVDEMKAILVKAIRALPTNPAEPERAPCDAELKLVLRSALASLASAPPKGHEHIADQLTTSAEQGADGPTLLRVLYAAEPGEATAPPVPRARLGTFDFFEENDAFGDGTDRQYTQGLRFRWTMPIQNWIFFAPDYQSSLTSIMSDIGLGKDQVSVGVFLHHSIYTPEDISPARVADTDELEPDGEAERWFREDLPRERPFGAWLAGGISGDAVWSLGDLAGTDSDDEKSDLRLSVEASLGCVGGSCALGYEIQSGWHRILRNVGDDKTPVEPRGWNFPYGNTRLSDKPWALQLYAATSVPLVSATCWNQRWFDAAIVPELALGDVFDFGGVALRLRLGQPASGFQSIPMAAAGDESRSPALPTTSGWFFFVEAKGRLIVVNRFIDNDPWNPDDLQGDKSPLYGDLTGGFQIEAKGLLLSGALSLRSPETKEPLELGSHLVGLLHVGFRF